jgi:prevent-host-death family protein
MYNAYMTTEMNKVTAREFHRALGEISDRALREPVIITKQGRDHLVLLSAEEYKRLKRRDRQVYLTGELPDDLLALISTSEMDPSHNHLNRLLDE